MNPHRRTLSLSLLGAALTSTWPAQAQQPYPNRTIKLITLATPSSADSVARALSQRMAEKFGQPVIVENRPGAGGTVAVMAAVRSAPDGYSFLITPNQVTIAPWTTKNLGYEPLKDLVAVGRIGVAPFALAVHAGLPVKTFAEFIALVRSQPGKFDYGTPGIGTPQHLSMEYIKQELKLHMVHIPYPQSGPAVLDTTEGRIAGGIFALSQVMPFAQSGKLRILAVIGDKRSTLLPEVPAIQELGVNALDSPWVGIFAPAGTPAAAVERINREANAILALPEVRQPLFNQGVVVATSSPAEFDKQVRDDLERWRGVVANAGIKPE